MDIFIHIKREKLFSFEGVLFVNLSRNFRHVFLIGLILVEIVKYFRVNII